MHVASPDTLPRDRVDANICGVGMHDPNRQKRASHFVEAQNEQTKQTVAKKKKSHVNIHLIVSAIQASTTHTHADYSNCKTYTHTQKTDSMVGCEVGIRITSVVLPRGQGDQKSRKKKKEEQVIPGASFAVNGHAATGAKCIQRRRGMAVASASGATWRYPSHLQGGKGPSKVGAHCEGGDRSKTGINVESRTECVRIGESLLY